MTDRLIEKKILDRLVDNKNCCSPCSTYFPCLLSSPADREELWTSDHFLPVSPQSICRLPGALHPTPSVAEGWKKLAACFKLFRDGCKSASVAFCWLDALPRQTDLQLIHIAWNDDADFWKRPLILPGQTRLDGGTSPSLKILSCGHLKRSEVPAYMSVLIPI